MYMHDRSLRAIAILLFLALIPLTTCGKDSTTSPRAPEPTPPPPPPPPAPVATRVEISPSSAALTTTGQTVQLSARVFDQNNAQMSGAVVTWSSSAVDVASVSGQGLVTAVKNGTATITGRSGNASASITVTVTLSVSSIAIEPASATLMALGETVQLTAAVLDRNGQPIAGALVTWTSSAAGVATVSTQGLVTAVKNGTATITARSGSASATSKVTVMQSVGSIVIEPASATLMALGETVQLTATVLDPNRLPVADAVVTWTSSDDLVATVSTQGLVTAVQNGVAAITARSGSASASIPVTVMQSVGSIAIEPASATLMALGETVQLTATVLDRSGQPVAAAVTWSSSDASVATVSEAGLVTAVSNGSATISARSGRAAASVSVKVRDNSRDREALIALYNATDGPNWSHSNNWLSDEPLDAWYGVSTTTEGTEVDSLVLRGNGLRGPLPQALDQLLSLELLNLSGNQLSGPIPSSLGQLQNLETADSRKQSVVGADTSRPGTVAEH